MDQYVENKGEKIGENMWLNFLAKLQLVKGSLISQMKGVMISVTHGFGAEVAKRDGPADFVSYIQAEADTYTKTD